MPGGLGCFGRTTEEFFDSMMIQLNGIFSTVQSPSDIVPGYSGQTYVQDAKIRFELQGVYYFVDSLIWNTDIHTYGQNTDKAINIYMQKPDGSTSNANLPNFSFNYDSYVNLPGAYSTHVSGCSTGLPNKSRQLAHNLGLCHTYLGGGCPTSCQTMYNGGYHFNDIMGSFPGNCPDCSQWNADPGFSNTDSCTNNLLAGNGRYLSPKQIGVMHRNLSLKSVRKYVIPPTILEPEPIEISDNQIWDFDYQVYSDVVVKSRGSLTVTCNVRFPEDTKIIVEPNAILTIDGGRLTNWGDNRWDGIYVSGNTNASQSGNPSLFGKVILKNNAKLEHAQEALNNFGLNSSGTLDWNAIGGIIQATDATFSNNRRSAQFMAYTAS